MVRGFAADTRRARIPSHRTVKLPQCGHTVTTLLEPVPHRKSSLALGRERLRLGDDPHGIVR
jgi:hypothetical protein